MFRMDAIVLDIVNDPAQRQWAVLAIGVAAAAYLLFRARTKKKDPLEKAPMFSSLSSQRVIERQMQNLLVELSEMARQISAQLDTRAEKLQLLIREADEKIKALNQLSQKSAPSSHAETMPANSHPPNEGGLDPRHADVYTLADQGRSPGQIAQTLGRPNGEIELILALRPRT